MNETKVILDNPITGSAESKLPFDALRSPTLGKRSNKDSSPGPNDARGVTFPMTVTLGFSITAAGEQWFY
jgi:hypothetical protein